MNRVRSLGEFTTGFYIVVVVVEAGVVVVVLFSRSCSLAASPSIIDRGID